MGVGVIWEGLANPQMGGYISHELVLFLGLKYSVSIYDLCLVNQGFQSGIWPSVVLDTLKKFGNIIIG